MKFSIITSLCISLFLCLQSCKKEDCAEIAPVEIKQNKTAFHRDSFFTLEVPIQAGLFGNDYEWKRPNGQTNKGIALNFDYLTPSDEGSYVLTIGKDGCSKYEAEYYLDIQTPPVTCNVDSNKLQITSSNSFSFNYVSYDSFDNSLEASNANATLRIRFYTFLDEKPEDGIYNLSSSSGESNVYVTLSSGFSQWFFTEGLLYVYVRNNKLTVKSCLEPFRESNSGFETTASFWVSEP